MNFSIPTQISSALALNQNAVFSLNNLVVMKFTISAVLALAGIASAANVARQSCPQATRFGVVTVSPTTVSAGDVRAQIAYLDIEFNGY